MDFTMLSPLNFQEEDITLSFLKESLQLFQEWQIDNFKIHQGIDQLVSCRARYIDQLLTRLWAYSELDKSIDLSLISVGGYGRAELHPKSDIDILLLSPKTFTTDDEKKISNLYLS